MHGLWRKYYLWYTFTTSHRPFSYYLALWVCVSVLFLIAWSILARVSFVLRFSACILLVLFKKNISVYLSTVYSLLGNIFTDYLIIDLLTVSQYLFCVYLNVWLPPLCNVFPFRIWCMLWNIHIYVGICSGSLYVFFLYMLPMHWYCWLVCLTGRVAVNLSVTLLHDCVLAALDYGIVGVRYSCSPFYNP